MVEMSNVLLFFCSDCASLYLYFYFCTIQPSVSTILLV